ncbi:MAG: hypothetical protein RIC89_04850 [Pseudomonadales bacterium]
MKYCAPRYLLLICLGGLLTACVSHTVRVVDMTPPRQASAAVSEAMLLDVGIAVFDANVPEDFDTRIEELIIPEVRRAEAQYFPYFLKNLLQSTGNWGAVRVVPRHTDAVDVNVAGKILKSNGESLEIEATVQDASGRLWFTRTYTALASKYAYGDAIPANVDAFQAFYKDLANDMLDYLEALDDDEVRRIRNVAEMKFARGFASDAFANHVRENEAGEYELIRLPAAGDPMLERVRRIREREYLFIDTLEEYYANFYRQMYPHYNSWRKANYEQAIAYNELRAQAKSRAISGTLAIVGSVASIYESNNAFVDASGLVGVAAGATLITSAIQKRHEAELQAERMRELGSDAEAELVPTTLELENQTARLEGSVEQQYDQLRQILRRIYFEDLNLPQPDEPAEHD